MLLRSLYRFTPLLLVFVLAGCASHGTPVSHDSTATSEAIGSSTGDAKTLVDVFKSLKAGAPGPLQSLIDIAIKVTDRLQSQLAEASKAYELTQANAASLYGDVIHWKEQAAFEKKDGDRRTQLAEQAGDDALDAERGHILTLKYRAGVTIAVIGLIAWQVGAAWLHWGSSPLGLIGKLAGR